MKPEILLCLLLSACEFPAERDARELAEYQHRLQICERAQTKPVIEFVDERPVVVGCAR